MNKIKELRLSKGINRVKFAHAIGVSPRHVAFIESGDRKPSITVALKIAYQLGVSVNDIFAIEQEA